MQSRATTSPCWPYSTSGKPLPQEACDKAPATLRQHGRRCGGCSHCGHRVPFPSLLVPKAEARTIAHISAVKLVTGGSTVGAGGSKGDGGSVGVFHFDFLYLRITSNTQFNCLSTACPIARRRRCSVKGVTGVPLALTDSDRSDHIAIGHTDGVGAGIEAQTGRTVPDAVGSAFCGSSDTKKSQEIITLTGGNPASPAWRATALHIASGRPPCGERPLAIWRPRGRY